MLHLLEIVLAIIACGTLAAAQECAEDWYEITPPNTNPVICASYIKERLTYDEARAWCRTRGNVPGTRGRLAIIRDRATQSRLEIALEKSAGGLYPGWIGLRNYREVNADGSEVERYWEWDTGARLRRGRDFENWAPNTPNDDQIRGGQDCVYMNDYRRTGSWNDFECNSMLHFVCQYNA